MTTKLHRISHMPKPKNEWMDIVRFLEGEDAAGIRKKLCVSCGFGKLYDKKGTEIRVSRYLTLASVKEIVNLIKAKEA